MRDNILLKILCSIPVILVTLYFIPFLGVCLLIFRYIVYYYDKRRISTPYYLVSIGLIILIPKLVQYIFKTFNLKTSIIPYFDTIINSNLYNTDFIKYSKLLIILGIIFLIITSIVSSFVDKTKSYVKSYITNQEKRNDEISRNLLYIAITRAEENLNITTWGRPTSLLPDIHSKLVRGVLISEEEIEEE